jgi:phosphoglycolate phosphatase-like HAD superfamily hydrolase
VSGASRAGMSKVSGARELLATLTEHGVPWAIATSGHRVMAEQALPMLGLEAGAPLVTREIVQHAKPDPDLFLAAAALIGVDPRHAWVVGDSVWDLLAARRAGALGIGLLSGGSAREELERAGAYRVYAEPPRAAGPRGRGGRPRPPIQCGRPLARLVSAVSPAIPGL